MTVNPRTGHRAGPKFLTLLGFAALVASAAAYSASPSNAQERGGEQFLAAVASGSAQAVAQEIHPTEIEKLRTRLLTLLRAEASRGDSTYRSRLFGPGRSLADLESMTAVRFYTALSDRLRLRAREFSKIKWMTAIPEDKLVHIVGRTVPPKERGAVGVLVIVTLASYGEQWRAVIPSEIEAQIDDLLEGRVNLGPNPGGNSAASSSMSGAVPGAGNSASAVPPALPTGITELLTKAEASLDAVRCEEYYDEYMSDNFKRATSRSARKTLVTACTNNESTRETLITTLRIVALLQPRMEMEGTRAIFDVSGQGLPYQRFVLERKGDRWYIAE